MGIRCWGAAGMGTATGHPPGHWVTQGWPKPSHPSTANRGWARGAAPVAPGSVAPGMALMGSRAPSLAAWGGRGVRSCPEPPACGEIPSPSPGMICHQVLCVTAGLAPWVRLRTGVEGREKGVVLVKPSKILSFPDVLPQLACGDGGSTRARPAGAGRDCDFLAYFLPLLIFSAAS